VKGRGGRWRGEGGGKGGGGRWRGGERGEEGRQAGVGYEGERERDMR
jgi:hypothetical protein